MTNVLSAAARLAQAAGESLGRGIINISLKVADPPFAFYPYEGHSSWYDKYCNTRPGQDWSNKGRRTKPKWKRRLK